jgi:hypothetical protein
MLQRQKVQIFHRAEGSRYANTYIDVSDNRDISVQVTNTPTVSTVWNSLSSQQGTYRIFSGGNLDISLTPSCTSDPFPTADLFFRLVIPGNEAAPLQGTWHHGARIGMYLDVAKDIRKPVDCNPCRVVNAEMPTGIMLLSVEFYLLR